MNKLTYTILYPWFHPPTPPPRPNLNVLFFIIVGDCALMSLLAILAGYNTTIISL